MYDIDPIKKVERSGKSDTTSTTDSIRQGEENVNTQFSMRNSSGAVTLNVENSAEEDGYTYDNISIMLDGKEVGTIGMVADENEPYLERIDIDEKYRNKGIGTDALRLVAEKYGEFLIAPDNEDAKRLYERYGDESSSDNAAYIDQGYGVYSISSVPESKGYTARQAATQKDNTKFSMRVDSEGRKLSEAQQEFFKDSKVRDEEGRLLTVYHGSDKEFFVFDRTKARANMDIQGSFFSPWKIDAQGYGGKVGEYYLNIVNPASEAMGYKALKKFQGQNGAGIKAREYLQSLGYDGVNNGGEEYIAFESNQIKSVTNQTPTENPDIRYSMRRKLDSFDSKEYNEVKLGKQEYARLSAAIGTYQPNARGFVTQILDNEKGEPAYCYDVIVSDNRIVVLRKYGGTNIHEKRRYAASYKERKDTYRGIGGRGYAGQSNNSDDLGLGGRATAGNDEIYQRGIEGKAKSYGRKSGENTSDSGEGSGKNLTVSDLDKIQYQLRIEDKNRLNILEELKPMRKSTGFFCCLKFRGIIIS